MARKSRRGHRAKKNRAIPIAIVAPLVMPAIVNTLPKAMSGDIKGAAQSLALEYAGIGSDGKFRASQIMEWAVPTMIGVVVHKGANKFGVNKYARKASFGALEI